MISLFQPQGALWGSISCWIYFYYLLNIDYSCLKNRIFTTLSQNVCFIDIHILIHQHAICDCKLSNIPWLCWVFNEFSHIINNYSFLNCCIFTRISQTMCQNNTHILICRYARWNYRLWMVFWFKCLFLITCLKRYIFTNLSQIVYLFIRHNCSIPSCQT